MPWLTDENGERVYKASIYSKDELPTWYELYYDFYLNKKFSYDGKNNDIHHYWKLPNDLVLISICCNQLNKMIADSGTMSNTKFFIEWENDEIDPSSTPPIYSIKNPNGKDDPFIVNDYPRIHISEELNKKCSMKLCINGNMVDHNDQLFCSTAFDIIRPIADYFLNVNHTAPTREIVWCDPAL